MSSFTTPLILELLDNGTDFEIHEQFGYRIGSLDSKVLINIPVGYVTDFASTPWFIWWLLPPTGKYGKATVVHDYLCSYHKIMNDGLSVYVSRKQGDDIFREAMTILKVPKWKIELMYYGVRAYAIAKGLDKINYGQNADTDIALAELYADVA